VMFSSIPFFMHWRFNWAVILISSASTLFHPRGYNILCRSDNSMSAFQGVKQNRLFLFLNWAFKFRPMLCTFTSRLRGRNTHGALQPPVGQEFSINCLGRFPKNPYQLPKRPRQGKDIKPTQHRPRLPSSPACSPCLIICGMLPAVPGNKHI